MAGKNGPALGVTEAAKGRVVEGVVGALLGLGGAAILQKGTPTTEDKVVAYGLVGVGGLALLDAFGVNVLKGIGL